MMRSETVRWGKKLQPSFTSNAKMWSSVQVVEVSVATCDMLMSMYLVLLLHIIHPDHTFPILKTYI